MTDPTPDSASGFNHYRSFALILALLLLALFLRMVASLLLGVVLGGILAAITRPMFDWFVKITRGRRKLSAVLSLFAFLLFVVVPAGLIGLFMASDAINLANQASDWFRPYQPQIQETFDRFTSGGSISVFGYDLQFGDVTARLQESIGNITKILLSLLQKTVGGLASGALLIFIALYTLYFAYLDGDKFWEWVKQLLPLKPEQSERLRRDFLATSRASIKTLGVIGVVQGGLGGIGFWICGIPGVLFWSILMMIASVIPLIGSHLIIIPAGIVLILMGKVWYGVGLIVFAWIVIANIDNFLRPVLIGKQTELPELVVFLSTIGGLAMFGFFGFLIGPVIAALLRASLHIYAETRET